MKSLVLYPYPTEYDGQSLQGHYLLKGLQELGEEAMPCDRHDDEGKRIYYKEFKPDVVYGIGFWGDAPDLVMHPLENGLTPVPWLNANGWVANYHDVLNSLPLILATSNWVKATYIRDGVNPDNIHVAPIGYDPNIFYPRKPYDAEVKRLRRALGVEEDELMILTAGGDVTSKGAQEVLKALAQVDKKFSKWKYVCKIWPSKSAREHGKDERKLIHDLGLDEHKIVYMKDKLNQNAMSVLLNACDIYAAPSRLEGFGMIQLEAQACGKPVVSINVGGPADTIIHEETGFLVDVASQVKLTREWVYPSMGFDKKMQIEFSEPKTFAYKADVNQLADYIFKLLTDKSLRERMGNAAAKHAYDTFNYKATAKHIVNLTKKYALKNSPKQTRGIKITQNN